MDNHGRLSVLNISLVCAVLLGIGPVATVQIAMGEPEGHYDSYVLPTSGYTPQGSYAYATASGNLTAYAFALDVAGAINEENNTFTDNGSAFAMILYDWEWDGGGTPSGGSITYSYSADVRAELYHELGHNAVAGDNQHATSGLSATINSDCDPGDYRLHYITMQGGDWLMTWTGVRAVSVESGQGGTVECPTTWKKQSKTFSVSVNDAESVPAGTATLGLQVRYDCSGSVQGNAGSSAWGGLASARAYTQAEIIGSTQCSFTEN